MSLREVMLFTTKKCNEIDEEVTKLLYHPALFEAARVDGFVADDLVKSLLDDPKGSFVKTYHNKKIVAITSYSDLGDEICEAHTFVLPTYRNASVDILSRHLDIIKGEGFDFVRTVCSNRNMNVKNFLIKRLGFVETSIRESSLTVDGNPLTLFNLVKELRSFYYVNA